MKMKKWLAGVLAAAMCFAGSVALAECTHGNTNSNRIDKNHRYTQINDEEYHQVEYDSDYTITCADCGTHLSSFTTSSIIHKEYHKWNIQGVCEKCSYTNPCTHENLTTNTNWENEQHTQTGDAMYHQLSYDEYEKRWCLDCYMTISNEYLGYRVREWYHTWSEDGTCEYCEQENICEHSETRTSYSDRNIVDSQIGDWSDHQSTCDQYEIIRCSNCNLLMSETFVQTITQNERHYWETDGICHRCGQKNECPHVNTESNEHETYDWEHSQIGHPKYHRRTVDVYERVYCKDCHSEVSDTYLRTVTYDDFTHNWNDDGICGDCGQINECLHEETTNRYAYSSNCYDQIGDAKYHRVTYDMSIDQRCVNCDLITSYGEKNTYTYNDTHSWNEDGICSRCEQVNDCVHEEVETNRHETNGHCENTNDPRTHKRIITYYNTEDCVNCAKQFSQTELLTEEKNEAHWWNPDVCGHCEYVCQHGETTSREYYLNYRNEPIGDFLNHKYTWDVYVITECGICYEELSDEFSHVDGTLNEHSWNDSGFCNNCNQENTCPHENADVWTSNENWRYEQIGSNAEHEEIYDRYEIADCSDCGMYQKVSTGTTWQIKQHWWNNEEGICYGCGQENTCEHNTQENDTQDDNWRYENIGDSRYHKYKYDVYNTVNCGECGLELSREYSYTQEYTREHYWNDENICVNCEQKNICTHDGETETNTEYENYRYESTGDLKRHERKYDVYEVVNCVDCGIQISKTFKKTESYQSWHTWNSKNFCDYCDQTNTCTHENYSVNTSTKESNYKKTDASTHLHAFRLDTYKYCGSCGLSFDEQEGRQYESVEPHQYYGEETCEYCGYVCEHTNTQERKEHDRTCTDLEDGLNHSVVEEIRYYIHCNDCDRKIGDYTRTETKEYIEEHGDKYYCQDCGFEAVCLHENGGYDRVDWVDTRYVKISDNTHDVYGKTEVYTYCNECHEYLGKTKSEEEMLLSTEVHRWNEQNVCRDCDFANPNPCTHENTEVVLKQTYGSGWIAQNDAMHAETVIYKEVSVCSDCGKTFSESSSLKKVTKTEEHHFDYGTCWTCGYQNPCEHDGATHTKTEAWGWREDPICIDDKTHKINATHVGILTYCDLCGDCIKEEDISNQWVVEEHRMWGDHCEWCDYKIACEHENTTKKVLPSSDYLFCESISSNAHAATYILYSTAYCEDCDTLLEFENESDEVGMTKVNEPHNMVSGRCVECGYCTHPAEHMETTSKSGGSRKYVKYDQYLHEYYRPYDHMLICKLCGETVKEWVEEYRHSINRHSYDSQGICRDCGYVNECLHENAYCASVSTWIQEIRDVGDENQHQVIGKEHSELFCPDCLMSWSQEISEEPIVSMENHQLSIAEGAYRCWNCGYISDEPVVEPDPCLHEDTSAYKEYDQYLYEYVDENGHAYYGIDRYEEIWCNDCEKVISDGLELVEKGKFLLDAKEEHNFNDASICRCGYVNPCRHEHTETGAFSSGWVYTLQLDNTHHKNVNIIRKHVFCADCNAVLGDVEPFEEYITYEMHSFNEFGVCSDCKYVTRCKHPQTQKDTFIDSIYCEGYDDVEHTMYHELCSIEVCLSCGMTVGGESVETERIKQKHDGEDACSICGWFSPEHIHEWELSDERMVYSATAIDELTHEAKIQRGLSRYCAKCDWYAAGRLLPAEFVVEPHCFTESGRCEECGYVNFCEHGETYERPIYHRLSAYEMKDENDHAFIADVTMETRCKFCDQCISRTAELNAECTEEHVFDNVADLLCDLCGYEKEPPEEVPTPEPTPAETPEPTDTPAPTKKPSGGSSGGSGSGTTPSKPKDTATPTPEEALPRTGDTSLPMSFLLLVMLTSICGLTVLVKRKHN